ncbi:hypothetical protein XELAEV_18005012mg [Xenopus laevis]|uniref:Uncharacterized protein n=1 Tax=Xenopus laevis TaxID=8355 RepID=A0A974DX96_XENLA|nr:hypothetical protein XELAEV_18005012mg [Xenopus laevis]
MLSFAYLHRDHVPPWPSLIIILTARPDHKDKCRWAPHSPMWRAAGVVQRDMRRYCSWLGQKCVVGRWEGGGSQARRVISIAR